MRIYFETSAVNSLARDHTIADAIATKAFQNLRGKYIQLFNELFIFQRHDLNYPRIPEDV